MKTYALIAGILFALVALVHLWRIVAGWDIVIDGTAVPMWVSWVGLVIPGALGGAGIGLGSCKSCKAKP
jgi:hypothetical protein